MNKDLINVCIYADTTGLFTEEECEDANLMDVYFPEYILRKWYETHSELAEETADDLHKPLSETTYDDWSDHTVWAGDTDGLWQFSIENGYTPTEMSERW